jgi:hypothetical protein
MLQAKEERPEQPQWKGGMHEKTEAGEQEPEERGMAHGTQNPIPQDQIRKDRRQKSGRAQQGKPQQRKDRKDRNQ